jgi:hypothetical protein
LNAIKRKEVGQEKAPNAARLCLYTVSLPIMQEENFALTPFFFAIG